MKTQGLSPGLEDPTPDACNRQL